MERANAKKSWLKILHMTRIIKLFIYEIITTNKLESHHQAFQHRLKDVQKHLERKRLWKVSTNTNGAPLINTTVVPYRCNMLNCLPKETCNFTEILLDRTKSFSLKLFNIVCSFGRDFMIMHLRSFYKRFIIKN